MFGLKLLTAFVWVSMVSSGAIQMFDPSAIFGFDIGSNIPYSPWDICPYGSFATKYSYWFTDNSGSVGVRLTCGGSTPMHATSKAYKKNERTQESPDCAGGYDGMKVKLSPTAGVTEFHMRCSDDQSIRDVPAPDGITVSDAAMSDLKTCSAGHVICGVRSQIDTANGLVGVEFVCCEKNTDVSGTTEDICDFETDTCGFTSLNNFNFYSQNDKKPFDRVQSSPFQSYIGGPSGPHDGSYFIYYDSSVDATGSTIQNDPSKFRRFHKTFSDAGTELWTNIRYSFWFNAYGQALGDLYFQVFDENSNLVQESLVYETRLQVESDLADGHYKSEDVWKNLEYPLFVNRSLFEVAFEVKDGPDGRKGNFGLDLFTTKHQVSGSCLDSPCAGNATCTNTTDMVGYSCECFTNHTGDAYNKTDACQPINPCTVNVNLCSANGTNNTCDYVGPNQFECNCISGYELSPDGTDCLDINECLNTSFCGHENKTVCTNLPGSYECKCAVGYNTDMTIYTDNPPKDLDCDLNGGWTDWSLPSTDNPCSVTCGGGVYNATRNCTNPERELPYGLDCIGLSYDANRTCNAFDCPSSCAVWKNCSACENKTAFLENGVLNMTLRYFDGLSSDDLTTAMTLLSQWNQTVIEEVCESAFCDVAKLNESIAKIEADNMKIDALKTATANARLEMRDILDCNPDDFQGHNEFLWDIFDKLCEYDAFLPHIYSDLSIKSGMLTAERDRCAKRTYMRQLMELMYRKW